MAGRKSTTDQVAQRRERVAELYLKGQSQTSIAQELGVVQSQISYDLNAIREEWKAARIRDFNEAQEIELSKIDNMEREYWEAWERSKQVKTRKSKKIKGQAVADRSTPRDVETTDTTEERNGDPRYLQGVQWCIDRRIELLGLQRPELADGNTFFGWKPEERPAWWKPPGTVGQA